MEFKIPPPVVVFREFEPAQKDGYPFPSRSRTLLTQIAMAQIIFAPEYPLSSMLYFAGPALRICRGNHEILSLSPPPFGELSFLSRRHVDRPPS